MDKTFDEFIVNSKETLAKNFLFAVAVFIAYSFIIFKKEGGFLNSTYILSEILFFVAFTGIYLNKVMSLSKAINNTAEEINFTDGLIIIKTYPFNFFSITNKKAQTLTTNTHKIFVRKVPYPLAGISNESVLVFVVNNLDVFILPNSLPPDFNAVFLKQKKAPEMLN